MEVYNEHDIFDTHEHRHHFSECPDTRYINLDDEITEISNIISTGNPTIAYKTLLEHQLLLIELKDKVIE